jgi:hypothetical protein
MLWKCGAVADGCHNLLCASCVAVVCALCLEVIVRHRNWLAFVVAWLYI